jgi:tryptophan-rich sensory protein
MTTRTSPSPSAVPTSGASWILLALYVAVTAAASLTGSMASDPNTSAWYQALNQPPFQPPSWAFGVVWPILYLMMAYAGWRADAAAAPDRTGRLRLAYGVQLLFNAGWTIAFFALQSIVGGFVVILGAFGGDPGLDAARAPDRSPGFLAVRALPRLGYVCHFAQRVVCAAQLSGQEPSAALNRKTLSDPVLLRCPEP